MLGTWRVTCSRLSYGTAMLALISFPMACVAPHGHPCAGRERDLRPGAQALR